MRVVALALAVASVCCFLAPPKPRGLAAVELPRSSDPRVLELASRCGHLAGRIDEFSSLESRVARVAAVEPPVIDMRPGPAHAAMLDELEAHARELTAGVRTVEGYRKRADAIEAWHVVAKHTTEPKRRAKALYEAAMLCDWWVAGDLSAT